MDTKPRIIFSPPDITEEEVREVSRVLLSGWITTGPETKELERRMAAYCGMDRLVCLNSATACMEMTYRLLGIGEGDEVITTAYTYTATASAILHTGARPVLVDVAGDDESISPYEIDYEAIAAAITPRTRAITAVDIGGVMCDYDRLRTIAESYTEFEPSDNRYQKALGRIAVIADSAHGFGAGRGGYKSGQAADFTSFSFHAVKNLTTAEGGAVTWRPLDGIDNEDIYREFMLLSLHGQSKDALAKEGSGGWEYDIMFPGYKCNMTDVQAAIGMIQLQRYPELLARRRAIVARYDEGLKRINERLGGACPLTALTHYTEESTSSGHLYLMRVGDLSHEERSRVIARMAERGVPTNVHYKPLPLLTAYKNLGYRMEDYPRAYDRYRNGITLPLHTTLSDEDVDYILQVLEEILRRDIVGGA